MATTIGQGLLHYAPQILQYLPYLMNFYQRVKTNDKKDRECKIIEEMLDKLQSYQDNIDRLLQNQDQANQVFQTLMILMERMEDSDQAKNHMLDQRPDLREQEVIEDLLQMLRRVGNAYTPQRYSGFHHRSQDCGSRHESPVCKKSDSNEERTFYRTFSDRGNRREGDYTKRRTEHDSCMKPSNQQKKNHCNRKTTNAYDNRSRGNYSNNFFDANTSINNQRIKGVAASPPKPLSDPLVANGFQSKWRKASNFNEDSGSVWVSDYQGNVHVPEICFYSVTRGCRYEDVGCKRLHAKQHFHWQVKINSKGWINLATSQVLELEEAFCDPSQERSIVSRIDSSECSKEIRSLFGRDSWRSDFTEMVLFNPKTSVTLKLRRLCSESINGQKIKASWNAWYFLDRNNEWVQYGNTDTTLDDAYTSNITSDDIEIKYRQNPNQKVYFKNSRFSYILDFTSMKQINTSTDACRRVRRRPVSLFNKSRS